jgi:hypothetical protein
MGWVVALLALATVVVGATALGSSRRSPDSRPRAPISVSVDAHKPASHLTQAVVGPEAHGAKTPAIPALSVQSLPQVASGTISLAAVAATHRLFIDGRVAPNGTEIVTCGRHVVRVGSRGVTRTIDVPCGQEVVVAN